MNVDSEMKPLSKTCRGFIPLCVIIVSSGIILTGRGSSFLSDGVAPVKCSPSPPPTFGAEIEDFLRNLEALSNLILF